jgi:cobalt-zinc-cadmium resistance protein CzcA
MFQQIIAFSLRNKFIILLATAFLALGGIISLRSIPLDAVPDITNNQVQVVTTSPSLATEEVEQFITFPIEMAMANLPGRLEVRSISRYGLSVVTVVFDDDTPIMLARQYVSEQLAAASGAIPEGMGEPELMPITTGLGEIYQYTLTVDEKYKHLYNNMQLRTLHDWLVKRQLAGIEGIVEVSSFGGYLKQYEVAVDPMRMNALGVSFAQIKTALSNNNANTGGGYIERGNDALYIRSEGLITNLDDLAAIPVAINGNTPILIRDVATVRFAPALRYGAMTMNGQGEVVGGITLMLKGANSYQVVQRVKQRIADVEKSLPVGVSIVPYLDRSDLISKTVNTATNNLVEGGLIVILVLLLLLGDWRAALIVASVIPLSMLFALIMMNLFGVSANLMSLGAIDFGIVVDGAVIIVEAALFTLHRQFMNKRLTARELDGVVEKQAGNVYGKAAFGVLIILLVFMPVLSLSGIEGKMFRPMAQTVSFALLGALILSLTYVPVVASMFLNRHIRQPWKISQRLMQAIRSSYEPLLNWSLKKAAWLVAISGIVLLATVGLFNRLGSEFLPDLEEGDLAMQMAITPGSALSESIATTTQAEQILRANFPEVKHVVSKIGTAEVPTDPMAIEDADIMIILKPKSEWTSADNREDLVALMKEKLDVLLGAGFDFTQPIQLRFNELMTGSKADVAIKIFGDDNARLFELGQRAEALCTNIPGAADIKVEQTEGMKQLRLQIDRERMARYGINIAQVNQLVETGFAGEVAGTVFEGEKRFDLVIRLDSLYRQQGSLDMLYLSGSGGATVPLREIVHAEYVDGPMQISREETRRRITVGINVRNRDLGSLVEDVQAALDAELNLPPGYYYTIGGQYENFLNARNRLLVVVPLALLLILALLYFAFNNLRHALLIFTAVPLSAVGGVLALWLRGMPFSISAGIGFIALFGVAVLNGIVLLAHVVELTKEELNMDTLIKRAALDRLRPVLMTALTTIMGFLPMALSTSAGAEVQKPLATVVIGGLISATLLTMLVLPALLKLFSKQLIMPKAALIALLLTGTLGANAQIALNRDAAIDSALKNNPEWLNAGLDVEQAEVNRNTAVALQPLTVNWQQGQIDGPVSSDYQLQIQQNFGSLLTHVRRNQQLLAQEELAKSTLRLRERGLRYEVALKYENWVYRYQRFKLAAAEYERFKQLGEKLENQYQLGEISALEHSRNKNQLYTFYTLLLNEENKWLEATRQMRSLVLVAAAIQPQDTSLEPRLIQADSALVDVLVDPAMQAVEVEQRRSNTARSNFFPAISVGYFNQTLAPEAGLQGYLIGVQIPLWFVPQKARVKQAKIEVMKRQNEYNGLQKRYAVTLQTQWNTYTNFRNRWQESIQDALLSANKLQDLSEDSFLQGEIDYLNLAQSIETALALKFTYLENLFLMNQSAIQLEYLVKAD